MSTGHPPPPQPSQANADRDHLRLLSVFHYVVAAMSALVGSLFIMHIVMGIAILQGIFPPPGANNNRGFDPFGVNDPRIFGTFAIVAGSCAVAFGWTMAVLLFIAGRELAAHRGWTYCMVVAALACLFSPFGTILGVFTIVVLCRQGVRELFAATRGAAVANIDLFGHS